MIVFEHGRQAAQFIGVCLLMVVFAGLTLILLFIVGMVELTTRAVNKIKNQK